MFSHAVASAVFPGDAERQFETHTQRGAAVNFTAHSMAPRQMGTGLDPVIEARQATRSTLIIDEWKPAAYLPIFRR